MGNVIEIAGLRKEYRRVRRPPVVAIAGLDLAVPEGGVFGFLGPNGSGKTTTIRCMLGLVRASSGRTHVLGQPTPAALRSVMPHVGAIVETPALFPTMTGQENLRLLGAIDRIGPRRVAEVLEVVGLTERAGEKVGRYSLGMRQRLGLAAALLKDPALLVLDEPANGLDPAGIREIRQLLVKLGAEGRTVFVSSHLLAEIEHTCDRVAILDRGRCVLEGRVDDVLAQAARPSLLVGVDDLDAGARLLAADGLTVERADSLLRVALDRGEAARVTKVLAEHGHFVTELRPETVSLEDLFLNLTARSKEAA
ncbi:MAG: ABC-type multidrug transport system, ATPase component [Acidimicrobiales bacterium]|nr:ABC-type multidrug transport system, ATPase component [Acidimicrobiales bacterium]